MRPPRHRAPATGGRATDEVAIAPIRNATTAIGPASGIADRDRILDPDLPGRARPAARGARCRRPRPAAARLRRAAAPSARRAAQRSARPLPIPPVSSGRSGARIGRGRSRGAPPGSRRGRSIGPAAGACRPHDAGSRLARRGPRARPRTVGSKRPAVSRDARCMIATASRSRHETSTTASVPASRLSAVSSLSSRNRDSAASTASNSSSTQSQRFVVAASPCRRA